MAASKGDFIVVVTKKEVVSAVMPMQEHWLPLSNLDLVMPPVDVSVFFCYKKTPTEENLLTFGSMASVLKKSLAQALVSFYPLAGEMVQKSGSVELCDQLLCNNRGVDFTEAFADVELCDLNLYKPDESVQGKLLAKKDQGVFRVQLTELKCGGLVVACTFNHRVADAYSINMFLVSWAEIAQSKSLSLMPSFRRSLLSPRRPGFYSSTLNNLYIPISALPPPSERQHPSADDLISRIYYIPVDQLTRLQSLANASGAHKTKLEAFSAFLWKLVASGVIEKGLFSKLGIVVDGRTRLNEDQEIDKSKLFNSYFGNCLSVPYGRRSARELSNQSLSLVADSVHELIQSAVTKDHFLDLIDWVDAHGRAPVLPRVYAGGEDGPNGPDLIVSSGRLFPLTEVEFGWGKPILGLYYFPLVGKTGYVMPMPSPLGNGDWVVYMHMMKGQLEMIERDAGDVFRALTFDYLNGSIIN